jgi:hypothetical protein
LCYVIHFQNTSLVGYLRSSQQEWSAGAAPLTYLSGPATNVS